jgi:molecular chaperone GrpE (heat shock protein)
MSDFCFLHSFLANSLFPSQKTKKLAQLESQLENARQAQVSAQAALDEAELRVRAAYIKVAVRSLQSAASELLSVLEDYVLPTTTLQTR